MSSALRTRRIQRHVAWICACFAFFGAIAPAVSKMVFAAQGVHLVQICGVEGQKLVALGENGKERPAVPGTSDHFCGYCFLQQHSPVIPSVAVAGIAPQPLVSSPPVHARAIASAARSDWPANPVRGPPPAIS